MKFKERLLQGTLIKRYKRFFVDIKYKNKIIPRPTYWTGFRVEPSLIEFWQDMPFRLHDRVEYKKNNNSWLIKRLYP